MKKTSKYFILEMLLGIFVGLLYTENVAKPMGFAG